MEDLDFVTFMNKVKHRTGIDLSLYKEAQMKRRLTSLREKRGYTYFKSYYEAMLKDTHLFNEFLDRMTINVSEFFRNPGRWDVLEKTIIPTLLQENRRLRVWSAACSTGEEPYSAVMLLTKLMDEKDIQVLATDIDTNVIAKAKQGIYIERSTRDIPEELLNKYFSIRGIQYVISDDIKSKVTFQRHNLLADPFRRNFDLIICRNVMIYFTDLAKASLYSNLSDALRPGGVLFVGSTEQIFQPQQYSLEPYGTFFYRKV